MYNEIDMPLTKEQQHDADKKIRKSRYELAVKQGGPLYSMTITEYNKLKEEFGQETRRIKNKVINSRRTKRLWYQIINVDGKYIRLQMQEIVVQAELS